VRTAFHDAVARFGGRGCRSGGRCLPAESRRLGTPLTPLSRLARPDRPAGPSGFASRRGRLAQHRVNDEELPRPGAPSPLEPPIARRLARDRSLGAREGDATQHVIRSRSPTPRVLACRAMASSRRRFRTNRAPIKERALRSPFITVGGASRGNRWPVAVTASNASPGAPCGGPRGRVGRERAKSRRSIHGRLRDGVWIV
jgi:hypothetical protein